jgi:ATP-binding cassette, sub-family E, member 1
VKSCHLLVCLNLPFSFVRFFTLQVKNLSGGELQRVALALCLGKPADVYLIDEPSAYLDSEQRIVAAKIIKRFILHAKKTAFIVEHDFIMATYLADRVIVYEGEPGKEATANSPQSLLTGMNTFLKQLDITFRRDPTNFRPRINKYNSVKDTEQKKAGTYFYLEE